MIGARIAVGVSGTGSNLRALRAAERRGLLGGEIVLVFADRPCPALDLAHDEGIAAAVIRPASHPERADWDRALAGVIGAAGVDLVVLAGFMRLAGPAVLATCPGRILNVHPSLLPAFPGRDAVGDALAAGVRVTGVTVHLVDETLDGGPIVAQESVAVLQDDDREALAARIHAIEHRLLPRCVALLAAGGLRAGGRTVRVDPAVAAGLRRPRRALLSMSDKTGLAELGHGLAAHGFELVSTGGTARALREAGLAVTDVASVTGFPEMLDGRVKTLHPRIHGGVLADLRLADHRAQLAAAAIEPFEIVAVNLYRFADAAARPGIALDELVEEIDIGGPALVRAAAKNHASVAVVTAAADYPVVLAELAADGAVSEATRRRLALAAYRLTAEYDATIVRELAPRLVAEAGAAVVSAMSAARAAVESTARAAVESTARAADPVAGTSAPVPGPGAPPADTASDPASADRLPDRLSLELQLARRLRYGENPHQAAALYVLPGADLASGPFAGGAAPLQGRALSYNNLLDAGAAAGLVRDLRGHAIAIIKHGNPCGAAEGPDPLDCWDRALAGDPVSAFGGVVAVRGAVGGGLAERLAATFLEVVVAAAFDAEAREVLAAKSGLRLLEDPAIVTPAVASLELRSAGGAVLVTDADTAADDASSWRAVSARPPTAAELAELGFAWRVARHVRSNAIVLARGASVVGVGAGQMSRVDSARLAVDKAGPGRARGAVCASDAFFPFADALEACAAAGVTAFVEPGGSQRDGEVIAAADRAGAAMVFTGVRHFRH